MATTSPWEPPIGSPAAQLNAVEPLYRKLLMELCKASIADESLTSLTAIITLADMIGDLLIGTGALWVKPDLLASLRDVVDGLEQRRQSEPARELLTVREFFASSRPAAN